MLYNMFIYVTLWSVNETVVLIAYALGQSCACMGICLEFICNIVCYITFYMHDKLVLVNWYKAPTFQMPTEIIAKTDLICNTCYSYVGCII